MSKKQNTKSGMHPYQRHYEDAHGKQDWTKRTKQHIADLRKELGEVWFKDWKERNKSYAKSLGV